MPMQLIQDGQNWFWLDGGRESLSYGSEEDARAAFRADGIEWGDECVLDAGYIY